MTKRLTKDQIETKNILEDIKDKECKVPSKEKNILDWSLVELKTYILKETKGMNPKQKFKFAKEITDKIKKERALQNK